MKSVTQTFTSVVRPVTFLLLIAFAGTTTKAIECEPIQLEKYQFLDQNCRLFRSVWEGGVHYIVREKNGKVVAREAIDCTRSVLDEDGSYEYHSKLAAGQFYCTKRQHDGEDEVVHRR